MTEDKNPEFPKGFLWGGSTSAHQGEGGSHNQWTQWELKHAEKLAASAEKRQHWLPVWDEIKNQAEDPKNYISDGGVNHYSRYPEDFGLVKQLGLNSFRFSVEWSRIEPEKGQWDQAAIDHYKNYIKELKKRGIKPVINLWHWTIPL